MSEWTKKRLERMIADGVEESLSLEYKRADALLRTNGKEMIEITKDVSAFANSAGGFLIYGIAEATGNAERHLPERLAPVRRADVSKEWLDHVIQTIQPRIDGVIIHPVTIDETEGTVCYVVEIPQSHTAHQARNFVYYKRHNFSAAPMEDYEVRDVMNRLTHPKILASVFVNKKKDPSKHEGLILVKLENVGRVLVRHAMAEIELPVEMDGVVVPDGEPAISRNEEGDCYRIRLVQDLLKPPIFPGSNLTLRRKIRTDNQFYRNDGKPIVSAQHLKISVFADEMPPIRAVLDIAPVLMGWTPVDQPPSS